MSWTRDLFILGIVWALYSIYSRKDTSKRSPRPNGFTESPGIPPVDFEKLNFYEVLEVPEDANADDLKKAYRKKVLEHHPDKNLDDMDGAKHRFSKVQDAYETLNDPDRRADYDFIRANPPAPAESSYPGAEGYNVPPSQDPPTRGVFSWMHAFFASSFGSFGAWGRFPEPIDRLMPERYMYQSPPPVGRKSISIENLANFLEAFSALQQGPHRLEAETFFTLFNGLFRSIGYDESIHGGCTVGTTLCFGGMCHRWNARDGLYCLEHRDGPFIEDFYNFWTKFRTKKNFSWMVFCEARPQDLAYAQVRRAVDQQNQHGRKLYRENYNQFISELARKLMDMDPRRHRYLLVQRRSAPKPPHQNNKKKKRRGRR